MAADRTSVIILRLLKNWKSPTSEKIKTEQKQNYQATPNSVGSLILHTNKKWQALEHTSLWLKGGHLDYLPSFREAAEDRLCDEFKALERKEGAT